MAAGVSCQEDLAPFRGPKGLPVVLVRVRSPQLGVQLCPIQTPLAQEEAPALQLADLPVVLVWPAQSL